MEYSSEQNGLNISRFRTAAMRIPNFHMTFGYYGMTEIGTGMEYEMSSQIARDTLILGSDMEYRLKFLTNNLMNLPHTAIIVERRANLYQHFHAVLEEKRYSVWRARVNADASISVGRENFIPFSMEHLISQQAYLFIELTDDRDANLAALCRLYDKLYEACENVPYREHGGCCYGYQFLIPHAKRVKPTGRSFAFIPQSDIFNDVAKCFREFNALEYNRKRSMKTITFQPHTFSTDSFALSYPNIYLMPECDAVLPCDMGVLTEKMFGGNCHNIGTILFKDKEPDTEMSFCGCRIYCRLSMETLTEYRNRTGQIGENLDNMVCPDKRHLVLLAPNVKQPIILNK